MRVREEPPVVFVAALGHPGESWRPVLEELPAGLDTVTYDRPGLGGAPPRPAPNPPLPYSAFADELAALLDARGVDRPAVLVGHSIGALVVRAFADRHPHRVAGLVAVDGSIPQLVLDPDSSPVHDGDGPGATEIDFLTGQVEILSAAVPRVPAAVLVRRRHWQFEGRAPRHPALDDLWQVSQRLLAEQWSAPLIVAEHAGHQIPAEAPALVAYVVEAVVRAVRDGTAPELDDGRLAERGGRRELTPRSGRI